MIKTNQATIIIQCVEGGFIVNYPVPDGGGYTNINEVTNTPAKALRIVKAALEKHSHVTKASDDTEQTEVN